MENLNSERAGRPFESLYRKYDAWYDTEPGKSLFAIELTVLLEVLGDPPSRAIEIGVGSGRFAGRLRIRFGLDPAVNPLRLAGERGIIPVTGQGEALPFQGGVFDCCLLVVTLCFVRDPWRVLRETRRILREGGRVVLGMVLKESPWGKHYRALGREGHPFYSMAAFYGGEEIVRGLKASGFTAIEVTSTLFQPPGLPTYRRESPRPGYDPQAGFTVFKAVKRAD